MKKYSIVSASIISLSVAYILFSATSAFAAIPVTTSAAAQANVDNLANINVDANTNTSSDVSSSNSVDISTNSNNGASTSTTASTNSTGILNASINVDSDDPQLTSYAQGIAENDASVSAVSTDNNGVSISYKVPVKLFGFIPVKEMETATVNDSSDASATLQANVHRSWWSFLASGNSSSNTTAFSANLNNRLETSGPNSSQASIMADIEAAAQSSIPTNGSANANTSVSANY